MERFSFGDRIEITSVEPNGAYPRIVLSTAIVAFASPDRVSYVPAGRYPAEKEDSFNPRAVGASRYGKHVRVRRAA